MGAPPLPAAATTEEEESSRVSFRSAHDEAPKAAEKKSPNPSESPSGAVFHPSRSSESSPFSSARSSASPKKPSLNEDLNPLSCRKKIALVNPPSAFHPDIYPPSLIKVRRSLCSHTKEPRLSRREHVVRLQSNFRDDQGRFILEGSSGGYYVGDVWGGLPHGRGQHWIPCPTPGKMHLLYEGEWEYGSKSGVGSIFYTNGQEYRGELRDEQRWGSGWMRYKDGSFYAGDWFRGRKHGLGILYHNNGNWYYGAFCKDAQDGWGIFYWPSIRRKFEGEWVTNSPYSGFYSHIGKEDFSLTTGKRLLKHCPPSTISLLLEDAPKEEREILELRLQHPIWTIFNVISALRALKTGDSNSKNMFKTQAGRKESLSDSQLQILKKVFEAIAPITDNKAQLPVVHLRRLLVLARIDPDNDQGESLLVHLQDRTKGRSAIGFDEFLLYILQYHNP